MASIALSTDLYELTMAKSYRALGMRERATFSLFVRRLPKRRAFLVVAGVEDVALRLTQLGLDAADVAYLVKAGLVDRDDAEALARTRFTGDVRAVREGRAVFADEPILEIDAPIVEAQLVETLVLDALHYPTLVATKAARCVAAARGKPLVDFGLRRAPGPEAGLAAARACWLAGFAGTSNVLAGARLGVPVRGTLAHSFVEALPSERDAFRAWLEGGSTTLLVDTYDTQEGVRHAIEVARGNDRLEAIRLDSGDLASLSRAARAMLDEAGLSHVRIFASGGLDEDAIDALERAGAPIDAFGVGTRVSMSADAPVLDMAYKIVAYDGRPCLKLSEGKESLVGPKQVWRLREAGRIALDRICARDEPAPGPGWEPLLLEIVRGGRTLPMTPLDELRRAHADEMRALAPELRALEPQATYPVSCSEVLLERQRAAAHAARAREGLRDGAEDAK
jgi:nicotinate phosphoribosyltransferase